MNSKHQVSRKSPLPLNCKSHELKRVKNELQLFHQLPLKPPVLTCPTFSPNGTAQVQAPRPQFKTKIPSATSSANTHPSDRLQQEASPIAYAARDSQLRTPRISTVAHLLSRPTARCHASSRRRRRPPDSSGERGERGESSRGLCRLNTPLRAPPLPRYHTQSRGQFTVR